MNIENKTVLITGANRGTMSVLLRCLKQGCLHSEMFFRFAQRNPRLPAAAENLQGAIVNVLSVAGNNSRGDEAMGTIWSYLDMTALGRQEEWEDSPEGYPQTPPYKWWNWHDNYDAEAPTDQQWVDILTDPEAAARKRAAEEKA